MLLKSIYCSIPLKRCLRKSMQRYSTIFHLSSGWGKCGVAVIRVSGEKAESVTSAMTTQGALQPRLLTLRKIIDPITKDVLDNGLLVWLPKPKSFTGEDMCELHVHGSVAVITAVQAALGKIPSFRPAEPGEFTKRAFLNGKMDLTEVEGLADLLQAETEAQHKQAIRQMDGHLSNLYTKWREDLKRSLAHIEAFIDFGEDEEIDSSVLSEIKNTLLEINREMKDHLDDHGRGQRLRSGVCATIIGEPNVGKSSLLNLISGKDIAITSSIPGTTRDIVESPLNIGGYPLLLSDTAGIRKTDDAIEMEGVRRALNRVNQTDLVIAVFDARTYDTNCHRRIETNLGNLWPDFKEKNERESGPELICVLNKCDLLKDETKKELQNKLNTQKECVISCNSQEGLVSFKNVLTSKLKNLCGDPAKGPPTITQERHRYHLKECLKCLEEYTNTNQDLVLSCEEIRRAVVQLGKITGKVTSEEILDVIFKDFCIGK